MLQKSEAITKMNTLGKARRPFLFVIDFLGKESLILVEDEIDSDELLYSIGSNSNTLNIKIEADKELLFSKKPINYKQYQKAFSKVKDNLDYGNTYLVNLTQPTPISINRTTQSIHYQSKAKYKLWLKNKFAVFSPETFVQIEKGKIASYPMKGTIDARLIDAENQILNDPKEIAEHNTIVDLIRNDLSMIAKNVQVESFRYIDRLKTNQKELLQVSSKIIGDLDDDFFDELGTHFFKLLPAGSICGAPKKKTVEIILETENYDRGFYTGVFGFFDGKKLDSGVMIRFIEEQNGELIFKSGGGITIFSDAEKEYNELIDKVYVPIY
ncbi:MAG: aminodeoxychorismate synthase component I [Bacteroidales bacterium]|jgi:para-aminobenzoate synthetase component 1|nr:aminodeoxychorismate synthase component I [Bacteroidales bacterium]